MPQRAESSQRKADHPAKGRPRPPLFRALGRQEPPAEIEIQGELFRLAELFKHDSWAATAIYARGERRVVCKLNRRQPLLVVPMAWLGRQLARREADRLQRMADVPNVPDGCGPVRLHGVVLDHAVAHEFVPGQPLRFGQVMPDAFHQELRDVITTMHARGLAYVDLHKAENIIVGDDGRPYLIDFQISFARPAGWLGKLWPVSQLFRILTNSDLYHLEKHRLSPLRCKCSRAEFQVALKQPWWIRMHRMVAVPLRTARRALLVWLGIRRGEGQAESEHQPEHAVQLKMKADTSAAAS